MEENKAVEKAVEKEVVEQVTSTEPVKEEVVEQPKGALSMDDVDDVINPIIPVVPNEFNKCVSVVLESRPTLALVGKDNDKPAVVFRFLDKAKDARAVINMFLPLPLADQINDDLQKKSKRNFGALKHIFGALIPTGVAGITGNTYDEIMAKCIAAIPESSIGQDIKLNVKFVYNDQGWIALPLFPPFVSSKYKNMDFKNDPTYDKFVPPVKKGAGGASTEEAVDKAKYNEM